MKKTILLLVSLLAVFTPGHADERFKVALNNDDRTKDTLCLSYCNVLLSLKEAKDGETAEISINIENRSGSYILFLFSQPYDEKTLKQFWPSISFDKLFGGTKGRRTIEASENAKVTNYIHPSDWQEIVTLEKQDKDVFTCRIPLYIGRWKNKKQNKILLMEKQVIELDFDIALLPDRVYVCLNQECDSLLTALKDVVFCKNAQHPIPLKEQKAVWERKIVSLKERIDSVITARNYFVSDKNYQLFDELKQKLDIIDLSEKESDCGKHYAAVTCRYCTLSLQQIYHKLDDCYQKIYSSSNRKEAKAQIINEVNTLYNCSMRHYRSGRSGSEYKSKISGIYKRINQF